MLIDQVENKYRCRPFEGIMEKLSRETLSGLSLLSIFYTAALAEKGGIMGENMTQHEKDLEKIRNFRLMDDDFMTRVFDEDNEAIQFILRIILEKADLVVNSVKTQYEVHNLRGKSARLDVFAGDSTGRLYNIEIQRADKGAGRKRARYNSSLIDSNELSRGIDDEYLPETYVIFITENDVLRRGLPIYHIERVIREVNNEQFDDGEHIVFVNSQNNDLKTELGKLMHDFRETDPDKMIYPMLAKKSRYFKESEEGVAIMCKMMEDMRNEAVLNRDKEIISMLLSKGDTPEEIHNKLEFPMDLINQVQEALLMPAQ